MNLRKIAHAWKIAFLLFSFSFQNVFAGSILKDLVLAHILAQIIKPRFVPLPIPLPLPLKFQKHTYKPYPVPLHSHSLSAEHVGHSNSGYDLSASPQSLASHHDLSALSSISAGHDTHFDDISALTSLSTGHDNHFDGFSGGSELIIDKSNQLDNIHDDIEAIGGLDVLTDLDHLGESQKWW